MKKLSSFAAACAAVALCICTAHAQGSLMHNYEIRFPKDAQANCSLPVPDTILVEEIAICDLLAVSVQDEFFSASGDECYKILRTYGVINWCEYDGQSPPVIVGRDEDCDGIPGDEHVWVLVRPNGITYFDRDNNELNNDPAAFSKGTSCDGLSNPAGHWVNSVLKPSIASRGYWRYTQFIKVYDNTDPAITVPPVAPFCSYDSPTAADPVCHGPVTVPFSISEWCTPGDVTIKVFLDVFNNGVFPFDFNVRLNPDGTQTGATQVFTVTGAYPDYVVSSAGQGFPIGTHRFEIHAEDGCRNVAAVNLVFEVRDCKAPTPICYNGLTLTLMPVDINNDGIPDDGMSEICATDMIASPLIDCTPPIRYSLRKPEEAPDINRSCLSFSCEDYNQSSGSSGTLHVVYVDAWDGAGNSDFCETYILLQDQSAVCPGPLQSASISGTVRRPGMSTGMQGMAVALTGAMSQMTTTNISGTYLFTNLPAGQDYAISPMDEPGGLYSCISTLDLILIQRHILGTQPLTSPYMMIAADVNNSHTITTLDILILRARILGITSEPLERWRFIPADYVFPLPSNPWFEPFPERIEMDSLTPGSHPQQDFIAILVGDVNNCGFTGGLDLEDRSMPGNHMYLNVADAQVSPGEYHAVEFRAEDIDQVAGIQLALGFDPATLVLTDMDYHVFQEEHFGMQLVGDGRILISWHRAFSGGASLSGEPLFRLKFYAKTSGRLRDMLRIEDAPLRAEAYDQDLDIRGLALRFEGKPEPPTGFELYQNIPNPAQGLTAIGFFLPVPGGEVRLTLGDMQGRMLKVYAGPENPGAGYHQMEIPTGDLPAGVLQYTLTTGQFSATKRMVVVR